MTIGRAVTAIRDPDLPPSDISVIESKNEWWDQLNQRHAIGLSASDLTHHYIRAATTGSGKTVATLNDILSTYANLNGPTVVVDPKGGDMCENYLRCHRTLFGNLDDVEYIKIPEEDGMVPGIPFFDLRPLVEAGGRERATAVQNIVDHYFQVLYFALGKDTVAKRSSRTKSSRTSSKPASTPSTAATTSPSENYWKPPRTSKNTAHKSATTTTTT